MSKNNKKEETVKNDFRFVINEVVPVEFPEINHPVFVLDLQNTYKLIYQIFSRNYETIGKTSLRDIIQNPEFYVKKVMYALLVTSIDIIPKYSVISGTMGIDKCNIKGIRLDYDIYNSKKSFNIDLYTTEINKVEELTDLKISSIHTIKSLFGSCSSVMERFYHYIVYFSKMISKSYFSKKELYFVGCEADFSTQTEEYVSKPKMAKGFIDFHASSKERDIDRFVNVHGNDGACSFLPNKYLKVFDTKKSAQKYLKELKEFKEQ